ncbi:MAG: DUF1318 domain-containing protein [Verrucomicrobiales bacterium]
MPAPAPIARFPCLAACPAAAALMLVLASAGCKLPDVNLTTDEPIKVDVQVRLDVYQYSDDTATKPEMEADYQETVKRQRNRMAEIQELKNNRFVGENHRGLLTIRELPAGDQGDYVKKTVEAENTDRKFLIMAEAKKRDVLAHEIEKEQWQARISAAFDEEWIEVAGERDGTYKWVQKEKSDAPKRERQRERGGDGDTPEAQ